jgi:nitroreductase
MAHTGIGAGDAVQERRRDGDSVDLRDHTDEIVWAATRAPSYRNTQPWLFRVAARQVEVHADRSRSCPVADPDDRELFLSLGAAVFGVRLAMSRLRVRPVVGLSRDHAHPNLAAVVVAAGHVHAPDEDDRLYDQLDRRRTIWTPFTAEPFPVELELELADRIRQEGASAGWLLRTRTRRLVADLARRAATERLEDPGLRLETARWPTAMPSPDPAPALLAICTPGDHRADWLRAGQALHHVLLVASAAGVAGAFLSSLMDVPALRRRLRGEVDLPGCPQVLLGLGRPQQPLPPPSARRSVADVLTH